MTKLTIGAAALAITLLAACGDDGTPVGTAGTTTTAPDTPVEPVIDPGDGGDYHPVIDPADFVDVVDNPYFPLAEGSRWVYEDVEGGTTERVEVTVLPDRKEILGISATVVRDVVTVDGVVVEDTLDWYAQDREGNVWYLGEDVKNYEDGVFVDSDGSFEAGVDGALPGIVMLADPQVGRAYRQEFYEGEAEDLGEVIALGQRRSVPAGSYDDVLVTRDWNPLEPDVVEEKSYARGVGVIFEEHVQGDPAQVALIEVHLAG